MPCTEQQGETDPSVTPAVALPIQVAGQFARIARKGCCESLERPAKDLFADLNSGNRHPQLAGDAYKNPRSAKVPSMKQLSHPMNSKGAFPDKHAWIMNN